MKRILTTVLLASACAAVAAGIRGLRVGSADGGGWIVPTGQRVRPAGETLQFNGRPVDLALSPDGRFLYAKDNRGLVVADASTWTLVQEIPFAGDQGSSLHGLAVSRDGKRVYATNSTDHLIEFRTLPGGRVKAERQIQFPPAPATGASYPCGLALAKSGETAYVCLSRSNTLAAVDLRSGQVTRQIDVGVAPYAVTLSPDEKTAYVTDWGGRRPRPGERTALSAGTPTLVDERGVASSGTVSVVDLDRREVTASVPLGLHPSDLALTRDGNRLYVANANSDTVSVLDVPARRVVQTIQVRPGANLPFGSAPNTLALSGDEKRLFVGCGGSNAVAVVQLAGQDARTGQVAGWIPTGWYPGGLATDGSHLYVANIKGAGSRTVPTGQSGFNSHGHSGSLQRVSLAEALRPSTLEASTRQVRNDTRVPAMAAARERGAATSAPKPVPARVGEPSAIEHVVYVIKENRTYDQVFGDLPKGNRDASLCVFGREVTPNHHALAEQFVLLDNYYCNGVLSADGHSWATEGNVTDHLEKAFGGFTRSYTFGDDPLTYSSSGFLWDPVLARGLTFRNYGEMRYTEPVPKEARFPRIFQDYQAKTGAIRYTHAMGVEKLQRHSHPDYPGWNMNVPDVLRADVFLQEFREFEKTGKFPNLVILYLPQDHGSGTESGMPTPRAHVADNDLALGRIVEAISRSRFWPKTCIFVNEDDPQDGFDHVDGHRSLCLVVSPYARRGAVVSRFYNQTSVLHTTLRMLGCPPMNQFDAMAPLMDACFTDRPDLRPYAAQKNRIALDELNPPAKALAGKMRTLAEESSRMNFRQPDKCDEDLLNRIVWHSVKGPDAPYPARYAGAHGRGLARLGLKLDTRRGSVDAEHEDDD